MQISILLIKEIAQLFLMIFMGYVLVKAGLLKDKDSKVLSMIVLYLVIPCVIITAFQVDYNAEIVAGLKLALAASVVLQVVLLLVTYLLSRIFRLDPVELTSVYYSNSGNLIVPLVTFILGKEWVVYGCVFMSVQLVFLWTHCKYVLGNEKKPDLKKILLNVNMISIFVGVLLFFTRIQIPEVLELTMESVGGMIGPLSMIVAGMLIAGMDLKKVFGNKRVYGVTALRLLALPAAALLLLKLCGFASWHESVTKILLVTFLAVITPCASTITQMCQVYGNNSRYASAINVVTTIFSILSMPLMVLLFQMVIGQI